MVNALVFPWFHNKVAEHSCFVVTDSQMKRMQALNDNVKCFFQMMIFFADT